MHIGAIVTLLAVAGAAPAALISNAQLNGFGTYTVSGSALVEYFPHPNMIPPDPPFANASADAVGTTDGPMRDGFIELAGLGGGEFGSGTATIGNFSFTCGQTGCSRPDIGNGITLPFTLGVPFQIHVAASASSQGGGSGSISFHFSLFESFSITMPGRPLITIPGASVIIQDPSNLPADSVPEPATWGYFVLGAAMFWAWRAGQRSSVAVTSRSASARRNTDPRV